MKIRYLLVIVAGFVINHHVAAQSLITIPQHVRESLLESISSNDGESADYEVILNELEYLQRNPLDINTITREELQKLSFLTDFQITSLLEYRETNGKLLTIYELQFVYGFTDEVIGMLLPFVTVSDQAQTNDFRFRDIKRRGNHEITLRTQRILERARGYTVFDSTAGSMRYPGNPWLINARYEYEIKDHIRAGITVEKDQGEDLFIRSNRGGFDFNSAFLQVNNLGIIKSAIVGDYRLAFGQGLTLWSGAAPGKSSLPMNIVKRQDAIKAFTAADENNFFRGVAAGTTFGKFAFTGFYSLKNRDANITDTLSTGRICFSSFQESGYHRTASETSDEKSLREQAIGGNLVFRNNFLKAGSTLVYYQFDKYRITGDELRDNYDFEGNRLLNWGIDYSFSIRKIQLFGETSYGNHFWATLNGMLLHVNKYASFSLLYRNFGKGYFSLHSSAFSESSSDSNEEALYAGLVLHPVAKWKISGYADFYRFPWLKFGLSAPASGRDYLLQVDYALNKNTGMYLRIKYETDPEDEYSDSQALPEITELRRTGLRYHISYRLNEKILMQNRVELVSINPEITRSSQGVLIYQDVEYKIKKIPVTVDFRFAWFNTGSYDARIYAYEQDLTSGFSFPALYNEGYRTYMMIRYDISRQISGNLRFSQTNFYNNATIGSGNDMIGTNTRSEIKFQLLARF